MTRGGTPRTGLRQTDSHATWREVYAQLDVDPNQHEQPMYQDVQTTLDTETAAKPTQNP